MSPDSVSVQVGSKTPPIRMSSLQPRVVRLGFGGAPTPESRIQRLAREQGMDKPSGLKNVKKMTHEQKIHMYQLIAGGLTVVLTAMIVIWQVTR